MKYITEIITVSALLTVLLDSTATAQSRQYSSARRRNDPAILQRVIQHFSIVDVTVPDCLTILGNRMKFEYAVEAIPSKDVGAKDLYKPITLELENVTLRAVLNKIVLKNPAFSWKTGSNGFIRLYPSKSDQDRSYLLTRTIVNFKAVGVDKDQAISILLDDLTKVELNFRWASLGRGPDEDAQHDPILFDIVRSRTTGREVLDLLSAKVKQSWIMTYDPSAHYYYTAVGGSFSTSRKTQSVLDIADQPGLHISTPRSSAVKPIISLSGYNNDAHLNGADIDQKIAMLHIEGLTLPQCVVFLANRLNFRFAIEGVPSPTTSPSTLLKKVNLDTKQTNLGEVFDDLVAANDVYTWNMQDGLVRFYPNHSTDASSYLISQKIAKFQLNMSSLPDAVNQLVTDIQRVRPDIKWTSQVEKPDTDVNGDPTIINLSRENDSVRDLLDLLSGKVGFSWTVTPSNDGSALKLAMANKFMPDENTLRTKNFDIELPEMTSDSSAVSMNKPTLPIVTLTPLGLDGAVKVSSSSVRFDFLHIVPSTQPVVEHIFTIRNENSVPIILEHLTPSCSCTSAAVGRKPASFLPIVINPNEQITIQVNVDVSHMPAGSVDHNVRLMIKGQSDPAAVLEVVGDV